MKIGEVTDTQAIVWTRLTQEPVRIGTEAPMPIFRYRVPGSDELDENPPGPSFPPDWVPVVQYPEGSSIDAIEGAVTGSPGEARVQFRAADAGEWQSTNWEAMDPEHDFTRQFTLTGLAPATAYELRVEARPPGNEAIGSTLDGRFHTAPPSDQPARVVFAATTGTDYEDQDAPEGGFRIFQSVMDLGADFFVHTGDILYYDTWAKNVDLARWGWARMFSLPTNVEFHRQVPTYFMKDDHDTWQNDAWPTQESLFMGDFTFQNGVEIFKEQVPMGELTYRTFRWGQDVQIWLVEGRDYRSANVAPDGPGKTIWGAEQKSWFKETVEASDATFRILISPTPFVGPDAPDKRDSHANEGFATEGRELRQFLMAHDMLVICGDRHWQYVSLDDETGLREHATGAASDAHASGWTQGDVRPEHRYLNVVGGFLSVTAERVDGTPTLALRNHGVDGDVLFEDVLSAE
jgi:alkaline phosphatase D